MAKKEYDKSSENGLSPVFICSDNGDDTFTGLGMKNVRGVAALPTSVEDDTDPLIDIYFIKKIKTVLLDVAADKGSYTFTAPAGHGIIVGNTIELVGVERFIQAEVITVATNLITVYAPINQTYPIGSKLIIGDSNLATATGSLATPDIFSVVPIDGQAGHFHRMFVSISSTADQKFDNFGSATALTHGITLRTKDADGDFRNIFTWRTNGEFQERALDADYQTGQGGTVRGFTARRSFNRSGAIIPLDSVNGEELQLVVPHNLTGTTNAKIQIICQGHEITV